MKDDRLNALLTRLRQEVYSKPDGPSPELVKEFAAMGRPALHAVLLAEREWASAGSVDPRTEMENWQIVLGGFAKSNPRLLVDAFDHPELGYDTSSIPWSLGSHPTAEIAADLMRWLQSNDAWTREHSIAGLVRLRWEPAVPLLLAYLDQYPDREETGIIVRGMFFWESLRPPTAVASLRRLAEYLQSTNKLAGVLSWARDLADSIEHGKALPDLPAWWGLP